MYLSALNGEGFARFFYGLDTVSRSFDGALLYDLRLFAGHSRLGELGKLMVIGIIDPLAEETEEFKQVSVRVRTIIYAKIVSCFFIHDWCNKFRFNLSRYTALTKRTGG